MTLLQTVFADISFFEVCAALIAVGVVERALLRFAPEPVLNAVGITAEA